MNIKKISKGVIENFEKHYKENVIQPTTELNCHGDKITFIYSNRSDLKGKKFLNRVYRYKSGCKAGSMSSKYGMVYMEFPNNKQIRYDYIFYDENCEKTIQTFFNVEKNTCCTYYDNECCTY